MANSLEESSFETLPYFHRLKPHVLEKFLVQSDRICEIREHGFSAFPINNRTPYKLFEIKPPD